MGGGEVGGLLQNCFGVGGCDTFLILSHPFMGLRGSLGSHGNVGIKWPSLAVV